MVLTVIGWIVLGLLLAALANRTANGREVGLPVDIAIGLAGAAVGGFLFLGAGSVGFMGFNVWSLLGAAVGSVVLLSAVHLLRGPPAVSIKVRR